MFGLTRKKLEIPTSEEALPGRETPLETASTHYVLGTPLKGPFPDGFEMAMIGMGCFWGAERAFWQLEGVHTTAVGYSAGLTPNPTYEEVCTGGTGHNEVVLVVFDPTKLSYRDVLTCFWEQHDPTQGMRQGNDIGTQYRSGIYTFSDDQAKIAAEMRAEYQAALTDKGHGTISTEIIAAGPFYYAESYHQQYLAKNPGGYCGLGGTGVACPMPLTS